MSKFSRGTGPLVSILLPTRGRSKWLLEAVDSLHSNCADPTLVEYVFKVDTDDHESLATVTELSKKLPCRTLVSGRGRGYFDLHVYVNDLSAVSKGDWLFIFNDDARMKTKHWDQELLKADPAVLPCWGGNDDVCLIGPVVEEREISWEFPILRRKVVQLLGRFSCHLSNDSWIYWVMSGLNAAFVMTQIRISHFVNEIDDQTKREGRAAIDTWMNKFNAPDMVKEREHDQAVLRNHLAVGGEKR